MGCCGVASAAGPAMMLAGKGYTAMQEVSIIAMQRTGSTGRIGAGT
jgi:hypothetical protein